MKFSNPRLSVSFVDNGFPVGKATWIVGEPTLEIEWDDARPPSEIPIQNLSSKDLQTLFLVLQTLFLDTVSNHVIGE